MTRAIYPALAALIAALAACAPGQHDGQAALCPPDLHAGLALSWDPREGPAGRPGWLLDAASVQEGKYCNGCKALCSVLVSPSAPNGEATFETTALSPSECVDWAEEKCPTNLIKATCTF